MDKLSVIFQNLRHLFPWFAGHGVWKLCTGEYTQPGSVTASRGHQVEGFQHKKSFLHRKTWISGTFWGWEWGWGKESYSSR